MSAGIIVLFITNVSGQNTGDSLRYDVDSCNLNIIDTLDAKCKIIQPQRVARNPEFPGGFAKFLEYVRSNYVISTYDYAANNQGTIYLRFIVEKDGSLNNINVIRGVSAGLDAEAIRVLKLSPKWNSGIGFDGEPCRTWLTLPIKIRFDSGGKTKRKRRKK